MITKSLIFVALLAIIGSAYSSECKNPKVEATSFTSLDATILFQIAYITEFTLTCDDVLPKSYGLYAEVDGKLLTAARLGDNKYQVSWTEEVQKAKSGVHEVRILDEEGWASLRRARREDPSATVAPLLAIQVTHPGSYNGPWVNSEVLATALSIIIAYLAIRHKSKLVV